MPDAPPPRYNDAGRPLGDWLMVIRYDSLRDVLTLSWTMDATPWCRREQGAQAFAGDNLQDLREQAGLRLDLLAKPRLF